MIQLIFQSLAILLQEDLKGERKLSITFVNGVKTMFKHHYGSGPFGNETKPFYQLNSRSRYNLFQNRVEL